MKNVEKKNTTEIAIKETMKEISGRRKKDRTFKRRKKEKNYAGFSILYIVNPMIYLYTMMR